MKKINSRWSPPRVLPALALLATLLPAWSAPSAEGVMYVAADAADECELVADSEGHDMIRYWREEVGAPFFGALGNTDADGKALVKVEVAPVVSASRCAGDVAAAECAP